MLRLCFLLSLLVISVAKKSSSACTSFNNVVVNVKDKDGRFLNLTLNGCAERKALKGIKVVELYVRNQAIHTLGDDSVRNMIWMRTLSFWGNGIERISPGAFRNVPELKNVQLSYENIKEIPRGVFDAIPTTELLRIHNNNIYVIEDQAFANLVSLRRIIANNNKLEYWNRDWFANSTNLEVIDFQSNLIRTLPQRAFANFPKLREVYFDFNEISVIHSDAFKGIRNLEYLGLRYNRLTEIKEDIFPNDLKIRSFLIDANYLNFLPNEVLKKVSVKDITIDNNPWKCPCLNRINFWIYSTNGTMRVSRICTGENVPVCSYTSSFSQSCLEVVDQELTKRYIDILRKIHPPLSEFCARLD